jgi:hypothetical protein
MKSRAITSLKELKSVSNMYITNVKTITKNIKDLYEEDLYAKIDEVIVKIANDYSLDMAELKRKYLKKKKKTNVNSNDSDVENDANISDNESVIDQKKTIDENPLLYKFENDKNTYYVEMIENGKVFDVDHNEVGVWKNGNIEINLDIVDQLKIIDVQIKNCNDQLITTIVGNNLNSDLLNEHKSISATIESFVKLTKDSINNSHKKKSKNNVVEF